MRAFLPSPRAPRQARNRQHGAARGRGAALALTLLLLGGCTGYESKTLKLKFDPPNGFKLESEDAGPPAAARFSRGLTLYSVDKPIKALDSNHPDLALTEAVNASGLSFPGMPQSARIGSIPAGEVGRYELKAPDSRTLIYVVPRTGGFVLVVLQASEQAYPSAQTSVERSLSTLKLE